MPVAIAAGLWGDDMIRNTSILMLGTAVSMALAGPAMAQSSITTSGQFGPAPTDYTGAGSGAARLNTFDTTLGTLNSVNISVSYGFSSLVTVTNFATAASAGSVRTESIAGFRSSMAAIDSVLQSYIDTLGPYGIGASNVDAAAFDVLGTRRSFSLAPGSSTTVSSNGSTQMFSTGDITNASVLSAFSSAGAGIFNAQLFTVTGTYLDVSGGAAGASQATTATGTIRVMYNYTANAVLPAVPEPASWAMMILGVGTIGVAMRRRNVATRVTCAA